MRLFAVILLLVGLWSGVVQAQAVSVPTGNQPVIGGGALPIVPYVQPPPVDRQLANLEARRAALSARDYAGMAALGPEYLSCRTTGPFEQRIVLSTRQIETGRRLLQIAAQHGRADAQLALGISYLDGKCGSNMIPSEGYAWIKAALFADPNLASRSRYSVLRARSMVAPGQLASADYLAESYIEKYVKPFGIAALVRPDMPCPNAQGQVGVFLYGEDFAKANESLINYRGNGYPSTQVKVTTPQGCQRIRDLNRFQVRFAAHASVFDVNDLLRQRNACIVAMDSEPGNRPDNGIEVDPKANVVIAFATPPAVVAESDELMSKLRQNMIFQQVIPGYLDDGSACAPVR